MAHRIDSRGEHDRGYSDGNHFDQRAEYSTPARNIPAGA